MAILDVDSLTDSEIRLKFSELGCPVGPVTSTTRKTLLKKLKLLLEEEENANVKSDTSQHNLHTSIDADTRDGTTKTRRRSLPRSTNKSPKRRSPARLNVSSSQLDYNERTRKVDVAAGPSNAANESSVRPSRASSFLQDNNSRYSNTSHLANYDSPKFTTEVSSTVNHRNYDVISPNSSRFSSSTYGLGLNDSFRSKYNDSTNDIDFNLSPNPSVSSGHSFSSEFVKRLSASRNSQRSDFRTPVGISSKLLDVKESDDEDSGPAPVYAKFSQSGPRGTPITSVKNIRRTLPTEGWLPFDSAISTVLLFICLSFFVLIGVTYVNMHSSDTNLASPSDITIPVCLNMPSHVPGENCIREEDKDVVLRLFNIVYKEIFDGVTDGPCITKKQDPIQFSDDDLVNMIVNYDKAMSVWIVETHIKNLKVLLEANPKWKIKPTRQGISVLEPPISYYCYILSNAYTAADYIVRISLSCFILYVAYLVVRWWMMREARYKEDVYKLVSNIVDIVSSKAQSPDSYIPVNHVRDQLIPPKDRERMNKLWKDATTMLESDSRMRCEIQEVEGEEFLVWRWLPSSLNNSNSKRKVWQGQAFDTMEGSVNSLPHSPTAYLKIRHMFDAVLEEGEDWVTTVVNAILEKCGDAKILHVVVDTQSREGCVYMKCGSPMDAGIAYRALHGSWFDSNLVTVKYIREKRYLERFPESANYVQPLRPSNENKNSLS